MLLKLKILLIFFLKIIAYTVATYAFLLVAYGYYRIRAAWLPPVLEALRFVWEAIFYAAVSKIYPVVFGGKKNEKPIFKFNKNGSGFFSSTKEDLDSEISIAFNYLSTNKFNSFMVCRIWYSVEFFETMFINTYLLPFKLLGVIKNSAILGFFNLRVSYFNNPDLLTYYEYIAIRFVALILKLFTYVILSIIIILSFFYALLWILYYFILYYFNYTSILILRPEVCEIYSRGFRGKFLEFFDILQYQAYPWTPDRNRAIFFKIEDFYEKIRYFSSPWDELSDKPLIDNFFLVLPEILILIFSFYILIKALSLLELTEHRLAYTKFVLRLWNKIEVITYFTLCITICELFVIRVHELVVVYFYRYNCFRINDPAIDNIVDTTNFLFTYRFFLFDNLLIYDVFYLGAKLFFLVLFIIFIKLLRLTINPFYIVQPEQPFLITSLLFFFLVSIMSIDLNLLYICFEATTIIIVVLIAQEYSEFSVDAAVKYFSLNAITSGLFLFGTSIFYGYTLATEFLSISEFFFVQSLFTDCCDLTPVLFASTLIITSFFIKLAIWPGSLWVFDVYAGCSIAVLFLISVVLKIVLFFIFIRVLLFAFFYLFFYWKLLLLLSAVGSLVFSALGLSLETKLNSFIAYSSIGQFGFMLLGFIGYQNVQSLNSILLYLISYCTAICGIFFFITNYFWSCIR